MDKEYQNLIAKHLKGETSSFEEKLLAEWLAENEAHQEIFQEMFIVWKSTSRYNGAQPDVDMAWEKVRQKAGINGTQNAGGKVRRLFDTAVFMKVAAALLILLGLGYFIRNRVGKETLTELSADAERKEFMLPDSSKVWLNRNSRLIYSAAYNGKERSVQLQGEAFFDVRKNPEKPFIVLGKNARTQVLGTSFNVRAGSGQEEVEVVTGKVSFTANHLPGKETVVLMPGERGRLLPDGSLEKSKIPDPNFLAWKNDKLIFENTSLQQVAQSLQAYFNVPVVLENPKLANCLFTGEFEKPQLEEVMKVLSVSINLSYSKKENQYFLSGKGCN